MSPLDLDREPAIEGHQPGEPGTAVGVDLQLLYIERPSPRDARPCFSDNVDIRAKEASKKIMNNRLLLAIAGCLAMTGCSLISPDAQSVLQSSQKAMGSVKSI